MRWITTLCMGLIFGALCAQPLPDRYRTEVFSEVEKISEVLFSVDVPQPTPGGGFYEFISGLPLNADETDTDLIDLYMDIYRPVGDTLTQRPAVVICFGGGFLSGSKDHWSIVLIAEALARRGFVAATIDYRLGMNIFDEDLAARAVYRGIQDGRAAVKYLRANADSLGIAPEEVYIGGHSSGAFVALHNLYLDLEEERPLSTFEWTQYGQTIPDLGCLDCTGVEGEISGHASAAFNLAGALGFLSYIEDSLDARVVSFHSQDDGTVPYNVGEPFSDVSVLVFGSDLPVVQGSFPISLRCDTVSLPDSLNTYTDRGHGVHEAPGDTELYDDIMPGIGDWFYTQRLAPSEVTLHGDTLICISDLDQEYTYSVTTGDGIYFDWQVTGGVISDGSVMDTAVTILWSDTASVRSIYVTPYNDFLARGMAQQLDIATGAQLTNTWLGGSGVWTDNAKWSLGHYPTKCEDVLIQHNGSLVTIDIPSGLSLQTRSVTVFGNIDIAIEPGSILRIRQ